MRGGPKTPSRTTDANLDCAFVENALVFVVLNIGGAQAPPGPPCPLPLVGNECYVCWFLIPQKLFTFPIIIPGFSFVNTFMDKFICLKY